MWIQTREYLIPLFGPQQTDLIITIQISIIRKFIIINWYIPSDKNLSLKIKNYDSNVNSD